MRVFKKALSNPNISYRGRVIIIKTQDSSSVVEQLLVTYVPPHQYQFRFLTPEGKVYKVVQSDGDFQTTWFANQKKGFKGVSAKSKSKQFSDEVEFKFLMKNYDLQLEKDEDMIDRRVWVLKISPKIREKPTQELRVDKLSGVVLENKRIRPEDSYMVVSRFVEFNPLKEKEISINTQEVNQGDLMAHQFSPSFLSVPEWEEKNNQLFPYPRELPHGFVFESFDVLSTASQQQVHHLRYTDGMAIISIFQSNKPVQMKMPLKESSSDMVNPTALPERIVRSSSGSRYFTLISDLPEEFLREVAKQFK
ncbi:MAG: hypothetical protein ACKVQC_01990 [Elusimicrobiota bacterium]